MSTLFSGHYLRNRSTLDIGVLGYIGIVQHKEHSPEVLSIPLGTPCIYIPPDTHKRSSSAIWKSPLLSAVSRINLALGRVMSLSVTLILTEEAARHLSVSQWRCWTVGMWHCVEGWPVSGGRFDKSWCRHLQSHSLLNPEDRHHSALNCSLSDLLRDFSLKSRTVTTQTLKSIFIPHSALVSTV